MRLKLVHLCWLACAIPLYSQSWENLNGLRAGDRIAVTDSTGKEYRGAFNSVSAQSISLTAGKGEISIERARVRRVKVASGSRRLRNALIGIGIGVAIGVATDQTLGVYLRNESAESAGARALTYIAPIALVGGIAAAVPGYKTIYHTR